METPVIETNIVDSYGYRTQSFLIKGTNMLHRDGDLPAVIKYDKKGNVFCISYYKFGIPKNYSDGPSVISYNNGYVDIEQYTSSVLQNNGKFLIHHDTEPAYRWFNGVCSVFHRRSG